MAENHAVLINYLSNLVCLDHDEIPEKRLRRAVLIRGVLDVLGIAMAYEWFSPTMKKKTTKKLKREAKIWLNSNKKQDMSFLSLCEDLDLCPFRIRSFVNNLLSQSQIDPSSDMSGLVQ